MLSRSHLGTLLNYGLGSSVKTNCLLRNLAASASSDGKTSLNVETTFIQPDVQRILKKITGFDPEIVFPKKPVPVLRAPRYLFMSNEELRVARERAAQRGRKLLEMVPYMLAAEDNPQILEDVPELQGYETANLVFTDISGGANDRNRLIVVREPSGILRRASREERHRMNQTFFPFEERYHEVPKMFGEKQLERVLNRGDYVFALERAVAQFEPDDAEYIRVSHQVYAHVLENKHDKKDENQ
ncbi:28S ribosomal protein S22, mitochondrial [Halotydeus destructor]|nr:28S ribosomal protein S22, mitochondrial [Halotydeus destructor]